MNLLIVGAPAFVLMWTVYLVSTSMKQKNKIAKREAGSEGKIAQEIKIYIKEGGEQWRESGQSQRDDKGDLLTEGFLKFF